MSLDPFADPEAVREYLERFQRAQSILGGGVDPPPVEIATTAINNAAKRGITLSFHYVIDEDLGGAVWEMRVSTARGAMPTVRLEHGENWVEVLDREGLLRA